MMVNIPIKSIQTQIKIPNLLISEIGEPCGRLRRPVKKNP